MTIYWWAWADDKDLGPLRYRSARLLKIFRSMENKKKVLEAIQRMLQVRGVGSTLKTPYNSRTVDPASWRCYLKIEGHQATISTGSMTAGVTTTTKSLVSSIPWTTEQSVITDLPLSDPALADNIIKLLEKCDRDQSPSAPLAPS